MDDYTTIDATTEELLAIKAVSDHALRVILKDAADGVRFDFDTASAVEAEILAWRLRDQAFYMQQELEDDFELAVTITVADDFGSVTVEPADD